MSFIAGTYTLPAGYRIPVVADLSLLGTAWSQSTMLDIETAFTAIGLGTVWSGVASAGFVLTSNGPGVAPSWQAAGAGSSTYVGTLDTLSANLTVAAKAEYDVMSNAPLVVPAGDVLTVPAGSKVRVADWTWANQTFFSGAFDTLGAGVSVLMPPKSEYRIKGPLVVPAGQTFTVPPGSLLQVADFAISASLSAYLPLAGGVMTGALTLGGTLNMGGFGFSNVLPGTLIYADLQNESAHTLLGNPTAGAAAPSEITLGTNLSFSGSVLNAASGSGGYTGTLDTLSASLIQSAASEYLVHRGPLVVPAGDVFTVPAGSFMRVADWTQPGQTPYTGTFKTPPSSAGLLVLANSEYLVRGPVYTLPAGQVLTVQAGGYMQIADFEVLAGRSMLFQNQTSAIAIGPGYVLNQRSFGTVPYKIPSSVVLTIAAGAALLA